MDNWIYLSPPHLSGQEHDYVRQALESNWVTTSGPFVNRFEKKLEDYFGSDKRVLLLNSGTAAIHLALRLMGVSAGDTVIAPTFSFCAAINPILYQGALPIFVDAEKSKWGLDPSLLEPAIESSLKNGSKPKAIVLVHCYGVPAELKDIMEIAHHFSIPVLEDAAEAMGSSLDNHRLGTFGRFGVISFNGNKVLSTAGGGALLLDNEEYELALKLSNQGKEDKPYYHHNELGYNYRMSNVAAALGIGQLERLESRLNRREEIFRQYAEYFHIEGLSLFAKECTTSNRWLSVLQMDPDVFPVDNLKLKSQLEEFKIEVRLPWQPLHQQPLYEQYHSYANGVAKSIFKNAICLPSGSGMSDSQVEYVADQVLKLLKS